MRAHNLSTLKKVTNLKNKNKTKISIKRNDSGDGMIDLTKAWWPWVSEALLAARHHAGEPKLGNTARTTLPVYYEPVIKTVMTKAIQQ
jgi:hypothetical protein